MATVDKAFRVKNGLVVEGATATVNTHDVITKEIFDAKGDLLVGTGSNTGTRVALGTNGYVLTADSNETNGVKWAAAPAVGSFETSIVFEGTTANDFETTLTVTDPTADRTITFQDATGTVAFTSDIPAAYTDSDVDAHLSGGDGITYSTGTISADLGEGLGFDIEGQIVVDREITDPWYDAAGAAATAQSNAEDYADGLASNYEVSGAVSTHAGLTSTHGVTGNIVGTTDAQTLTNKTLTSPVVTGLILNDSSIVFEGSSADAHETTLTVTNPTEDRTITLPNVSGTVVTTGDTGSVTNTMLAGSIANDKLSNSAITINGTSTSLGGSRTLGSDDISEGSTNKYFTDERAQDAIGNAVGNGLDYNDETGAISVDPAEFALNAVGAPTANVSLATYKITSLGTPTDATDAATKAYVDSVTEGLHIHEAARAATTANVNLANALENGDTLDGITLATGDRILVKNQSTASENGIYVVQASGQPTRATDFDTATEVDSGDFIFVYSGTVNASTGWVQTNKPATIGTDAINFTQFSGAGTYLAGNGLTLTGNTFTINTGVTVDLNTAQTLTNKSISGSANTLTNIPNNALSNSAITINGTSVSLGGTRTLGTDDISEGSTNKYFSNELAQDAIGNALGSGLSYNDSTGAISVDTTTIQARVADVSDTEIGYLNGVTSAIQTQLNDKAPLVSPSFTTPNIGAANGTSLDLTSHITFADALMGSATTSLSTTSATVVDSWSATTYSSAKYIVQMKNGSDIEVLEVLVTVNGANNVYITEYADIQSNAQIGTTDADYSGGNVRLLVTATDGTTVKVHKTLIEA
jgi:hypothetical protein